MNDLGRSEAGGFLPATPSAEDIFKAISGGNPGWAGVDGGDAAPTESMNKSRNEDLKLNFVKTFSTPAGEKVLEYLLDISLRRGCAHPDPMAGIEQEALYSRERKGQNSIVCSILRMIVDGKNLPTSKAKTKKKKK